MNISALKNPHITIPFGIVFVLGVVSHLVGIFRPDLKDQCKEAADYLEKAALMWSTMAASQTGPANPQPPKTP